MARLSEEVKKAIVSAVGTNFILVQLQEGVAVPLYDPKGELLRFSTGGEASAHAKRLTDELGVKVQPRPVNNTEWRKREQAKFDDGTYRPLPWADTKWWKELVETHRDHFPHVSLQKQALIAYTENDEKGAADIQTPTKPGAYLTKHFGDKINEYMVRDLCTVFAAKFEKNEVLFATTAEDIEEVYLTGPSSCMSKATEAYPTKGVHPVRMYAAGDLEIAYLRREGRIVARTVAWPDRKVYSSSIYGDAGRIEPMLKKLGYKRGSLVGAKLLKSPVKGKGVYVVPHVDGACAVKLEKDHLVISDTPNPPGHLSFSGGSGITEACEVVCGKCGVPDLRARDVVPVTISKGQDAKWCPDCRTKHTVRCVSSGSPVACEAAIEVDSWGQTAWLHPVLTAEVVTCAATGAKLWRGGAVSISKDKWWSHAHYKRHGRTCRTCGYHRDVDTKCGHCGAV